MRQQAQERKQAQERAAKKILEAQQARAKREHEKAAAAKAAMASANASANVNALANFNANSTQNGGIIQRAILPGSQHPRTAGMGVGATNTVASPAAAAAVVAAAATAVSGGVRTGTGTANGGGAAGNKPAFQFFRQTSYPRTTMVVELPPDLNESTPGVRKIYSAQGQFKGYRIPYVPHHPHPNSPNNRNNISNPSNPAGLLSSQPSSMLPPGGGGTSANSGGGTERPEDRIKGMAGIVIPTAATTSQTPAAAAAAAAAARGVAGAATTGRHNGVVTANGLPSTGHPIINPNPTTAATAAAVAAAAAAAGVVLPHNTKGRKPPNKVRKPHHIENLLSDQPPTTPQHHHQQQQQRNNIFGAAGQNVGGPGAVAGIPSTALVGAVAGVGTSSAGAAQLHSPSVAHQNGRGGQREGEGFVGIDISTMSSNMSDAIDAVAAQSDDGVVLRHVSGCCFVVDLVRVGVGWGGVRECRGAGSDLQYIHICTSSQVQHFSLFSILVRARIHVP